MEAKNALQDVNSNFGGQFGLAMRDITPPIGIYSRNWGASSFDQAVAVHQPLLMHCLCMVSSGNRTVLLTADLGWWKNADDERKIRLSLLKYFQLEESQLIFALSHTHAGPSICSTDVNLPGGDLIPAYLEFIQNKAIECIEEGFSKLFEGSMSWSYGVCDLACNRDLSVDGDYLIGFNPLGRPDDTLLVGQIRNDKGELQAVLCNYACHPTSFAYENDLISADYVGEMRNTVEREVGVPCLFMQGASGDLAPKKQYVKEPAYVEANGRQLGYAVLSTLTQMGMAGENWAFDRPLISGAPLACWKEKEVPLNRNLKPRLINIEVPYKKLPSLESILEEYEACTDRVLKDRLWRKYNTRKSIGDKQQASIPVWLWKWGNAIIVAQANEAYSLFQKAVRECFPNHCIAFVNIANGYVGYLAPKDLYDKDIYAVWQSPYAKGSLEILIEETKIGITKLLKDEA
ncbi:MAG: hypothetical protein LBE37_13410 [Sphingobacterium sp.]|jgi:hypothetical protein|nr:hypothetical protein [Sphingobacterium sp.]